MNGSEFGIVLWIVVYALVWFSGDRQRDARDRLTRVLVVTFALMTIHALFVVGSDISRRLGIHIAANGDPHA